MTSSKREKKILIILGELGSFFFQKKKNKNKKEILGKNLSQEEKKFLRIFKKNLGKKNSKRALLYDHHAFNKSCHLLELWVFVFCFFFLAHNMK